MSLIELSLCNSPKCKVKFTGHWLRYRTTPNVLNLSTQSSQANNLALSILLQLLPGHCLCSNSDHRQKLTPIYQSLPLIMGQLLQQKYTDTAYPEKFGHKFAVKHLQKLQNLVPFLEGEPAKILEPVQKADKTGNTDSASLVLCIALGRCAHAAFGFVCCVD